MLQRYEVINHLTKQFPMCKYLEIGSLHHECFDKVQATIKHDVEPQPQGQFEPTFRMPSNSFFSMLRSPYFSTHRYNVIFIDGLHLCEQVVADVKGASDVLEDSEGFIVLHDCLPEKEEYQTRTQGPIWNGDVWKTCAWLAERHPNLYTIEDSDCGCAIIKGKVTIDNLPTPEELMKLTWSDFETNRKSLLRIVTWAEYCKI